MPSIVEPIVPVPSNVPNENYLRGLSLVSAMNAKARASEDAIQKMQLNEKMAEWKHEKDQEALQQNAEKMGDLNTHYEKMDDVRQLDAARKAKHLDDVLDQTKQDTQRLIDMQSKIYAIPAKRGTTDYQKQLDDIKDQYSDVTGSAEAKRIISPLEQQHKTARTEAFKAFNNQISSLGVPPQYAPAIFATPEMWQIGDEPKTGKMQFQIGTSTVKIPKDTYDKLKPKYQEFYDTGSAVVPTDKEDLPSITVISTQADYDGLSPNSPFIFNGKRGIKPAQ
jgi:hypothetical protein